MAHSAYPKKSKSKSVKELKESTKEKRAYLSYYKKKGKKSMTYGKWKKVKEVDSMGGSSQHRTSMSYQARRSPQLMADIMKMRDKKKSKKTKGMY